MMRLNPQNAALCTGLAAIAFACVKVPYTGRHQYNLIPDAAMRAIGKVSYTTMLAGVKVNKKSANNQTLQKVGRKVSKAANKPTYDWQFSMIAEDTVNAWCLPGGYIGFYNGILPALENEAGMAFVMGHEVGHATAHHGAERLSQQLTLLGGLVGLEFWMKDHTKLKPKDRGIVLGALGAGAAVGIVLPFSRMHEAEADVIGMMYMSSAGYPPAESLKVWDRMDKETAGGIEVPGFLSTHPSTEKRQKNQKEWLPTARKRYERNKLPYDTRNALWGSSVGGGEKKTGSDGDKTVTKPGMSAGAKPSTGGSVNPPVKR